MSKTYYDVNTFRPDQKRRNLFSIIECELLHIVANFDEFCSYGSNQQKLIIGLGNGSVPSGTKHLPEPI